MRLAALFLLNAVAPGVATAVPGANFTAGALCQGRDPAGPVLDILRGAHLKVHELEWEPFAIKDAKAPHGWRGIDMDLFGAVADMLGFTFEVHEPAMLKDEPYTDFLLRTVDDADLWLSWWFRDSERMNHSSMLFGHIDTSPVMVIPAPTYALVPPNAEHWPIAPPKRALTCPVPLSVWQQA